MEGLSRTDAIEWFKVCDKATLVLERFVEAPTTTTTIPQQMMTQPTSQSQLSSFEGVSFHFMFDLGLKFNNHSLSILYNTFKNTSIMSFSVQRLHLKQFATI